MTKSKKATNSKPNKPLRSLKPKKVVSPPQPDPPSPILPKTIARTVQPPPSAKKTKSQARAIKTVSAHKPLIAAKASNTTRQPVALASLHDCYLHTHLKKLSRRAQLRRAGTSTLSLLHRHTTLRVFDEICRACNAIVRYQRKKTITRAILLEACSALGLAIAH
jgi:hypothetical protein